MAFSRRQFLVGLGACPMCAAAAGVTRAEGTHWSYADPRNWGADGRYPACSIGGEQSPIDLTGAVRAEIEPPTVSWQPQAFSVVNNGHTIQANAPPGGFATSAGRRYELQQFHFHTPSEHTLDGKRAAMEAHFVHVGEDGNLMVIGRFPRGWRAGREPGFLGADGGSAEGRGRSCVELGDRPGVAPAYGQAFLPLRGLADDPAVLRGGRVERVVRDLALQRFSLETKRLSRPSAPLRSSSTKLLVH